MTEPTVIVARGVDMEAVKAVLKSTAPREEYEVQVTDPYFPDHKPMPHILIDGKIASLSPRLNLQPGDRVIIERKGQSGGN